MPKWMNRLTPLDLMGMRAIREASGAEDILADAELTGSTTAEEVDVSGDTTLKNLEVTGDTILTSGSITGIEISDITDLQTELDAKAGEGTLSVNTTTATFITSVTCNGDGTCSTSDATITYVTGVTITYP